MADEFFINAFPSTMPSWESPPDRFDSALSSMVSSPNASTSAVSGDHFMIRELIGKLGSICSSAGGPPLLPPYIDQSNPNSCYGTPLSSPPKIVKENFPNLPAMPGDPGFAERAAKFSSFGSRSFNGRTTQIGVNNANNNADFGYRSSSNFGKLQRVLSSPSLIKAARSQNENCKNSGLDPIDRSYSRENYSVSGQTRNLENGSNRKRKAAPKPKGKTQSPLIKNSNKVGENGEGSKAKRSKSEEEGKAKTEENRGEKQRNCNTTQKPAEPPKDYIHVRARRGQATDSHSLAERVRREKISERMKLLQDLVPGCNKVTGKALMLDEIINYVQSLQRQVEFLSMKLSTVNPVLEVTMEDNLFAKDVIQQNCSSTAHPMYVVDSLAQTHYSQLHQNNITTTTTGGVQSSVPITMDPSNPTVHLNHAFQLPPLHAFSNAFPQMTSLGEGDLQSIVEMSYIGQKECGSQLQSLLTWDKSNSIIKNEN